MSYSILLVIDFTKLTLLALTRDTQETFFTVQRRSINYENTHKG